MAVPTDHGQWSTYIPDAIPEGAPANAMFAQRSSDNQDWYEYVHPGTNFDATSVKLTVRLNSANKLYYISAPAVDATALFPDGAQIVELPGDYSSYTSAELIAAFAGKVIDLTTGDITNPPTLLPTPQSNIIKRLDALEKKYGLHTGN